MAGGGHDEAGFACSPAARTSGLLSYEGCPIYVCLCLNFPLLIRSDELSYTLTMFQVSTKKNIILYTIMFAR